MLLPVYSGQFYSYSYEPETGDYFLYANDYKSHIFLKGRDARLFSKAVERLDNLPPPDCNSGLLTEKLIKSFL
jgi:hypothetical protein